MADRADRQAAVAAAAMGLAILAAAVAAVAVMGVGPLAARVVARGVEASMALVARVAEATRALEVTVEMVAAKRVEAMGTLGRRGARSMLESTWRTCLAELNTRADWRLAQAVSFRALLAAVGGRGARALPVSAVPTV